MLTKTLAKPLAKTSLAVVALFLAGSAATAQPLSYWPDPFYPRMQMQYPVAPSHHYHVTRAPAWAVPAQRHYQIKPLDRDIYPGPADR